MKLICFLIITVLLFSYILEKEQKYNEKRDNTFLQNKNNNKLNDIKCYKGLQYIFIDGLPTYVIKDPRSNTEITC